MGFSNQSSKPAEQINKIFAKGSEWRVWDLHIHTPGTAKNDQYGKDSAAWESYISKLEANAEVAVLGITDYFSLSNYLFLKDRQKEGRLQHKTLLPNVELRILPVTKHEKPINIHVIFNPELSLEVIEREFFRCLTFNYRDAEYSCIETDLISLGRSYSANSVLDDVAAKKAGIEQFLVDFRKLQSVLRKPCLRSHIVVAVANSNRDGNSGIQESAIAATREEIYRLSDIVFSGNPKDVDFFLGKDKNIDSYGGIKPCVTGSDAHKLDDVNVFPYEKKTWIKADPSFEGLKQILYEPEDRVRIQAENPALKIEKSPFTRIYIPAQTSVFAEDDDVFFEAQEIPLNSNLVSIIGGRGSGKSILVNYIAAAFHKLPKSEYFNLNSNIIISRQASLTDMPKDFKVSENPNVPFMFIAQSQIKELVLDKKKFSNNIRETIGVADEYCISSGYLNRAESAVTEYKRIITILNSNSTTLSEKLSQIEIEIKKYTDFIANITSEQNRIKLETYQSKVESLHSINSWIERAEQLVSALHRFSSETNQTLESWNRQFKKYEIDIPQINVSATVQYIRDVLISMLISKQQEMLNAINATKNEFKDYTGDLTSLLSNVSSYQNKVLELKNNKELLILENQKYDELSKNTFKQLGREIKESIESYALLIKDKWHEFSGKGADIEDRKKEMLDLILQEDLEVFVNVRFDSSKMYSLLLEELDGRRYNEEKLRNILNIENLIDFYDFILQSNNNNIFNSNIREDLRACILDLFFKRYTLFISHDVCVTLSGKPISKLSFGQQGTIYLRLQIAANMFSETIIYDQPEDDLDNSFITSELISIFKKIKQYRQVIIVSHNANLVVNSDSEQVIIAENENGLLKYSSGSLENPDINKAVCQILEGGKTAFEKRERRYGLN